MAVTVPVPCFKPVLDHLHSVRGTCSDMYVRNDVHRVESQFGIVGTLYIWMTKCGQGAESCESARVHIEDAITKCAPQVQSLCCQFPKDDDPLTIYEIQKGLDAVLNQFLESIGSLQEEIEELHLICSNSASQRGPLPVDELVDVINSLLENLQGFLRNEYLLIDLKENLDALDENVRFLKSLIQFAALRGVQHTQMEPLLTLIQGFVLDVSFLNYWYLYFGFNLDMSCKISEHLQTIKPVQPHVHEIYVHVLLASKSSPSSPTPTSAGCKTMLGDFIDSLKYNLLELLNWDTDSLVSFKYQMQKLHAALIFLKAIIRKQQNKFDDLYEKIHDSIGVTICEAGIVIFWLFRVSNEQGWVKELDSLLSGVFNKIKLIEAEAAEVDLIASEPSFPRANMVGLVDSVLQKLKSFSPYEAEAFALGKDQFQTVHEGLQFLRSLLGNVKVEGEQQKKLQILWSRIAGAAYQIEFIIDSLMVEDSLHRLLVVLNFITEEIELIKAQALETFTSNDDVVKVQKVSETSRGSPSVSNTQVFMDHMVGFDDEAEKIIRKLVRGKGKLGIISVVGMPGIGKTTLAKRIYHDRSIRDHFRFCSWCTVSKEYKKNDLLHEILRPLVEKGEIEKNKDDLDRFLYQFLKGNRYLIILDDVWDCGAWNDLRISFPDDGKQSRILLTSRESNVASQIQPNNELHALRLFTDDESWELLQKKAFDDKGCPGELRERGRKIAQNCKGLPLTIVLVAGILANMKPDDWEQVEDHLSEVSVNQCKEVLELSYCHLPDYLKSCFLYFGIFQEDQQVPIKRLLWLWIAEGFVEKSEQKYLENVAEDYILELIKRNLIMIAKSASTGGVKTCIIHDLLHEFCLSKGKEEHFWHWLRGSNEPHTFNEPSIVHRLCVYPRREHLAKSRLPWPDLRNLLFVNDSGGTYEGYWHEICFIFRLFKLLRILDLRGINLCYSFPSEIGLFVHLRYLAIYCLPQSIPSSLGKLLNLETLILETNGIPIVLWLDVWLPVTLWNLKKLRHLCIEGSAWKLPEKELEDVSNLENLDTLSWVVISTSEKVLQKFPFIRKLKCRFHIENDGKCNSKFIALDFMGQLESLHLDAGRSNVQLTFQFPLNLKKLVLSRLNLPWSEISAIAELTNLVVLKLEKDSFLGDEWDMKDVEFPALRFLKLERLEKLVSWKGSGDHFPCLEKVVLRVCENLKELPSCLGCISTLEMIHVQECEAAASSIDEIRQELMNWGNEDAKIIVD